MLSIAILGANAQTITQPTDYIKALTVKNMEKFCFYGVIVKKAEEATINKK